MEEDFKITGLKPKYVNAVLSGLSQANGSLFDIEYTILSLLCYDLLMKDGSFADGYNLFTGGVDKTIHVIRIMERLILEMYGSQLVKIIADRPVLTYFFP